MRVSLTFKPTLAVVSVGSRVDKKRNINSRKLPPNLCTRIVPARPLRLVIDTAVAHPVFKIRAHGSSCI